MAQATIVIDNTPECLFSWYSQENKNWLEFLPADSEGVHGVRWRGQEEPENAGTLAEALEYFFWCAGVTELKWM